MKILWIDLLAKHIENFIPLRKQKNFQGPVWGLLGASLGPKLF